MNRLTVTEASSDLLGLLAQVNSDHTPREITSEQGNAVLISKAEWESLQETLYLQAIPGFVESVRQSEQADKWGSEAEFLQVLDGVDN